MLQCETGAVFDFLTQKLIGALSGIAGTAGIQSLKRTKRDHLFRFVLQGLTWLIIALAGFVGVGCRLTGRLLQSALDQSLRDPQTFLKREMKQFLYFRLSNHGAKIVT